MAIINMMPSGGIRHTENEILWIIKNGIIQPGYDFLPGVSANGYKNTTAYIQTGNGNVIFGANNGSSWNYSSISSGNGIKIDGTSFLHFELSYSLTPDNPGKDGATFGYTNAKVPEYVTWVNGLPDTEWNFVYAKNIKNGQGGLYTLPVLENAGNIFIAFNFNSIGRADFTIKNICLVRE